MIDPFEEIYRLSREGKYDLALGMLLIETEKELRSPYQVGSNHGWYVAGDLYFKKGDFEAAARAFDRAVAQEPKDYQALWALANCYSELDKPDVSERYLRMARKLSDDPALLYNLGNALFDQQRYAEALGVYESVPETAGDVFDRAQRNIRSVRARL